jgi:hypothetical protein
MPQIGPGSMNLSNRKSEIQWRVLLFELFVAFSLFVAYFYLVRNFFAYGNPMSANVFMAGSEKLYRLDQPIMGEHWNGRLSGLLMSGAVMDYSLSEPGAGQAQIERLANVFGLYHASWLLMLFVIIIFALRYSLFINLGIFAGLMYDFSPVSGPYFFPWDLPAMFFFTLAVLHFERRQMWLMAIAICAGAFFKETVMACALLVFFAGQWKWSKRIMVFISILAAYILGKKVLLKGLQLDVPALAMGDAPSVFQVINPVSLLGNLFANLKVLFAPTLNSVIFANAGTAFAVLVLCWQKRFLPYMIVILAYLAGLVFLPLKPAGITEVRVFMQILPLSFILLAELWMSYARADNAVPSADDKSAWSVRETFQLLLPLTIAVVAISTCVAGLQYYVLFEDLRPANQAQSPLGKYVYNNGSSASLDAICQWFRDNYSDAELKLAIASQRDHQDAAAIAAYQRVLDVDPNSIYALNNLATLLATDSDPRLRDGNRAASLAEHACKLTDYKQAIPMYTLAAAYAEAGRYSDAVAAAEKARAIALAQGQSDIAKQNEPLVELYKSGRAFHQQTQPTQ